MRCLAPHPGALRLRSVAGAHHCTNGHLGQIQHRQFFANAFERRLEIALDVIRQSLERRHVNDAGLVRQRSRKPLLDELVDRGEESRKGLARARRCRHQHVPPRLQRRPRPLLRRGRRIESPREPGGDGGVKRI